jgi:hypothetical protein
MTDARGNHLIPGTQGRTHNDSPVEKKGIVDLDKKKNLPKSKKLAGANKKARQWDPEGKQKKKHKNQPAQAATVPVLDQAAPVVEAEAAQAVNAQPVRSNVFARMGNVVANFAADVIHRHRQR